MSNACFNGEWLSICVSFSLHVVARTQLLSVAADCNKASEIPSLYTCTHTHILSFSLFLNISMFIMGKHRQHKHGYTCICIYLHIHWNSDLLCLHCWSFAYTYIFTATLISSLSLLLVICLSIRKRKKNECRMSFSYRRRNMPCFVLRSRKFVHIRDFSYTHKFLEIIFCLSKTCWSTLAYALM